MSKVYFLSDSHIGHKNLIRGASQWDDKSGCRDFNTVKEHDEFILNQINKHVGPNDVLYHLGDVAMGQNVAQTIKSFRERILCKKIHLVLGNHDHKIRNSTELQSLFTSVSNFEEIRLGKQLITICHYPMKVWNDAQNGAWCLHGHCHNSMPDDPNSLLLDVGVDTALATLGEYRPFSFDEIKEYMAKKTYSATDHHLAGVRAR